MDVWFENVKSGDCTIRVAVEGSGPLVLLVHGFPESWSSWRHQMGPIAAAGFAAAALDVRGYGGSSRPHPVEAYAMQEIVGDLQAIADKLGGGKAILVGRDWGAPIVWSAAQADPGRFTAVCGMSIPHLGGGQQPAIDMFRKIFTDNGVFFYMVYFQDEGVAERELEADPRTSLRKLYYAWSAQGVWPLDKKVGEGVLERLVDPLVFPEWMEPQQLDYLTAEFKASGFRGPLNRYRNFHRDFEWGRPFQGKKIAQPALFMAGEHDGGPKMFGPGVQDRMRAAFDDLRGFHVIPGAGHWNQEENPEATNRVLLGWLKGL